MVKILTKDDFNNFIKGSTGLAIVKFSAAWCSPCKLLGEAFNDILPIENTDFAEIDVDEAEEAMIEEHNIRNVPTVLFYKEGLQIDRFTGMIGREALENKIKENLAK